MFDTFILDIAFIQTTFVFIILVAIALWQKLKQFAAIMCGVYIIYLVFSIFDSNKENMTRPIKNIVEKPNTIITKKLPDIVLVDEIESEVSNLNLVPINLKSAKDIKVDVKIPDKKYLKLLKDSIPDTKSNVKDVLMVSDKVIQSQLKDINPIKIKYFKLGRDLQNRELINIDSTFYTDDERIYCMTIIQNQKNGKIIFHNWYLNNKLISKIRMEIGWSYNWRTWSYINVNPDRAGAWKIVVTDSLNVRYDSLSFNIINTLQ